MVTPEPAVARVTGLPPSIISDWHDPHTGNAEIYVNDPAVRSQAHADAGNISLDVQGARSVGRPNEPRVAEILQQKFFEERIDVLVASGSDDKGEDGTLRIGDRVLDLQITVVPPVSEFWRAAHTSSATTHVPALHAQEWLRSALANKAARVPAAQRAATVLAIDARHAGVLATPSMIDGYLDRHPSPSSEFGFASVWVVGPTAKYCRRIGSGTP